ncbi:hypothetical protein GGR26_002021 [Lewinella marina]|uniref:AsmA-like C-terminal domain-containing protein n=1 Tax=Neolewinella marina TaxID=438751 RepID=A0A2G0CH20_9BACT|nr:AsmA-like C-terminal region-containing protein [Neolewinella marina]NJB86253.1 hypothetical protein [Neolewinella marina]PHK99273.1 hypothetical protein CGL56_07400 [Neolewinella marina]
MRFLRNSIFLLLLVVLLPLLAVQLFGGSIARQVVSALNDRLQTEIVIQDYDLSLLRSFPHLAVDLRGVTVAGSDGSQLLEARRMACRLDLGSLFGKIRIKGIVVEEGKLQLFTDVDGNTNYQLTGYTSVGDQGADAGAEPVEFAIDEARLRNVVLVYQDAQLRTDALLTAREATFSGDFAAERYTLATEAELDIAYLDQEGYRYLDRKQLELEANTTIDHAAGTYTFAPLLLHAGELTVEATGTLTPTADGITTDLRLSSSRGELADVLALLPPTAAAPLADWETRGDLTLSATVQGPWTRRVFPRFDGLMALSDGRIEYPRLDLDARNLELEARFAYVDTPRGGGVQTFSIEQLSGSIDGEPFDVSLLMEDLADPRITFRADGSFPMAALPALFDGGMVAEGEGVLRLERVTLSGRYADMIEPRNMGRVSTGGTLTFDDAELLVNGRELSLPTGTLQLDDNALTVTDLEVETGETSLRFSGRATNLVPVLFADSLNSRDAALVFEATLTSDHFDVGELLALSGPDEEEAETAAPTTLDSLGQRARERRNRITEFLNGRFEATIEDWRWDELEGENFRGQLLFSSGQVAVRGLTDAMDGEFRIDATTDFGLLTRTQARITARAVDAETFFAQNENFGQEFLTADHISGRMNARILLDLYYDDAGEIDYNRLAALAGLEILDGELRDFEMLENFAFALKSGDLERVRFTRLANFIEIADRTVYLPAMLIQSSAINLTLSGSHTFDQQLEYYIKVNAGQVIANKISRHDDDLEVLPARNGLFNLYYTIRGPLESYVVETDKSAVKDDFRRSEYRRERIRRTLEERFQTPIELLPVLEGPDADVGG